MKRWCILVVLVSTTCAMIAQNWASYGKFNQAPSKIWFDPVDQRLLVAGYFTWFDSAEVHGFGYVYRDSIIKLGCGFEVDCGVQLPYISGLPKVTDFARYNGDLYVTGYFKKAGGVTVNGIAKWDGNDWAAIGSGLAYPSSSHGIGFGLEVLGNELYVFGSFDSINGVAAASIAKFDGHVWTPVFNFPKFNPSNPNRIFDAEWYQGELYVGGSFYELGTDPTLNALTKWDGTDWVAVGPGFRGSYAGVGELLTYQGKLIVGGHFNYYQNPGSIPGNAITAWDGQSWDTLRGGLLYRTPGGAIDEIVQYQNELYVAGYYDSAGGVPAKNLAKWNGERWCGIWDSNDFDVNSIAFAGDTLYMAIGYGAVGGQDSITRFAKWVGGYFGDSCQLVGIQDPTLSQTPTISLYPNPTNSAFTLTLPPNTTTCTLKIHDITGRAVAPARTYHAGDPAVDVAHLSAGLYFVEVRVKDRVEVVKLVKE